MPFWKHTSHVRSQHRHGFKFPAALAAFKHGFWGFHSPARPCTYEDYKVFAPVFYYLALPNALFRLVHFPSCLRGVFDTLPSCLLCLLVFLVTDLLPICLQCLCLSLDILYMFELFACLPRVWIVFWIYLPGFIKIYLHLRPVSISVNDNM